MTIHMPSRTLPVSIDSSVPDDAVDDPHLSHSLHPCFPSLVRQASLVLQDNLRRYSPTINSSTTSTPSTQCVAYASRRHEHEHVNRQTFLACLDGEQLEIYPTRHMTGRRSRSRARSTNLSRMLHHQVFCLCRL